MSASQTIAEKTAATTSKRRSRVDRIAADNRGDDENDDEEEGEDENTGEDDTRCTPGKGDERARRSTPGGDDRRRGSTFAPARRDERSHRTNGLFS
jgi:hypothetical protein